MAEEEFDFVPERVTAVQEFDFVPETTEFDFQVDNSSVENKIDLSFKSAEDFNLDPIQLSNEVLDLPTVFDPSDPTDDV